MSDPSEPSEKPDTPGPSAENAAALAPPADQAAKPEGEPITSASDVAASAASDGEPGQAEPVPAEATEPETGVDLAAAAGPEPAKTESEEPVAQAELTHEQIELIRKRRQDKTAGLVIVSITFILSMIGSLYAKKLAEPELSEPPGPPTTVGVAGWPKDVDPLQALAVARSATRRNLLRGFVAEQVNSRGTIDFSKKGRRVRYSFQSEPGHGPQPPRKADTLPRRTYCGKQNVHIKDLGVVADPDMASYPCATQEKDGLPEPKCTLKQVWEHALTMGAPKKRHARIEYYQAEAGPAYRFNMPGTKYRYSLAGDCVTELKGKDAIGGVP